MRHKTVSILVLLVCFIVTASVAFGDIKLPDPKKDGGEGIFSLLEKRSSGDRANFPTGAISKEELSTILWAATGLNRAGKGWTVPMAIGKPPYVKIYLVIEEGVFLYNWKDHLLSEVTTKNILADITNDDFVKKSPCLLIFVSDSEVLGTLPNQDFVNSLAFIASGAMTQNIYLAAEALGISGRYMISMNAEAIKRELKLSDAEKTLCVMPLGKK
jgi:nitroreductase